MTSDAEAFLLGFHARMAGVSSRVFMAGADSQGNSSYERLVHSIPQIDGGATIVDVGCGDGCLLELLRKRRPLAHLIGIDMSPEELAAARKRLGPGADLRCERAQATTLATGSVDCVLSHMALMLMAPVDEVIGEIHRVLRPGGVFAAIVGSDYRPPGAWTEFVAIARDLGGAPRLALGDARVRTMHGILELFAATGAWSEAAIDNFELSLDGTWPQVEAILFETYVPDLLEPVFREPLRQAASQRIPALAGADGIVRCRIGMRLMRFHRLPDTDHPT